MHDRRIDGELYLFGNAGGLYKNAMTWWDHQTNSIWSQPTGEVLGGELLGEKLNGLPFQLVPWSIWLESHPGTLVMSNDIALLGAFRKQFSADFLIGVELSNQAKAYPFDEVLAVGLIEDRVGSVPILIWAEEENYQVLNRKGGGQELHFEIEGSNLVDLETGSIWDPRIGIAREGPLKGQVLQQIPSFSIWEAYWFEFFPDGEIFRQE